MRVVRLVLVVRRSWRRLRSRGARSRGGRRMSTAVRHVRRPTAPRAPAPARPATYVLLVATVVVLNVVGVVMVLSASSVVSLEDHDSAWYYFQRHLMWMALGAIVFAVAQRVDYRRWRELSRPLLIVTAAAL